MSTLRDLETYLMVKDYMEENNTNMEEILESMSCKKVSIAVTCDGVMKKFYSLAFSAIEVYGSLITYRTLHKKSDMIVKRKGESKVFCTDWCE